MSTTWLAILLTSWLWSAATAARARAGQFESPSWLAADLFHLHSGVWRLYVPTDQLTWDRVVPSQLPGCSRLFPVVPSCSRLFPVVPGCSRLFLVSFPDQLAPSGSSWTTSSYSSSTTSTSIMMSIGMNQSDKNFIFFFRNTFWRCGLVGGLPRCSNKLDLSNMIYQRCPFNHHHWGQSIKSSFTGSQLRGIRLSDLSILLPVCTIARISITYHHHHLHEHFHHHQ